MKKYLLVVALTLISLGTNAQNLQGVKNFLRGFKYEIIVGINFPGATEPYNSPKIGYNLGFTARKEVKTFLNDKLGVYGLTGLVLTSRGGTTAIPFLNPLAVTLGVYPLNLYLFMLVVSSNSNMFLSLPTSGHIYFLQEVIVT